MNRWKSSKLYLFFVVLKRPLSERQGLLLNFYIFIAVYQIPIKIFDLIDGRDDLQAESHVRDFTVVPGDLDIAPVWYEAESLQQLLRQSELKIGRNIGTERGERAAGG